jgi:hypothetical protein
MPIIAGQITGSILTASVNYTFLTNVPSGIVSGAEQITTLLPAGTISSSGQVDYNSITNKLSGVVSSSTQIQPLLPDGTISSSAQYPGWVTSSAQIDITTTTGYSTFSSSIATVNDTQDISIAALNATTSSYAINSTIQSQLAGVVSSSSQVKPLLPDGTVTSSAQYPGWVTSSAQIDYNNITNKLSGVVSSSEQIQPLLPAGTVSSSGQVDITTTTGYSTFSSSLATVDVGQTVRIDNLASLTSSYAINSTIQSQLAGVVSSSTQVQPLLPGGTVSSSAQYPGWVTASSQIDYNSITNKLSGVVSSSTQVQPLLPANTVSSSGQVKAFLPGGTVSSSGQVALTGITGTTFATADFTFPQNLIVAGTLTAEQFITEYVSASVIYESGSSKFGDTDDDVMSVTGSILVLGGRISGSMTGMFSSSAQVDYNSITNKLSGVYSSSAFSSPSQGTARLTLNGVALSDVDLGLQTGDSPTFSGLTSTGTVLLQGIYSSSTQVDYNSIQNKLSGVVSSSAQVKPLLPGGTVTSSAQYPGWVTSSGQIDYNSIQNKLSGVVSSSTQVKPLLPGGTVTSSAASSPSQGTVRISINGVNTDVDTGLQTGDSPTLTGLTVTGLTGNQAVFTNGSDVLVSNAITGTGNVVMSASPTLSGTITADKMVMSGSQFAGIVSGSGTQYRLVVPVGTNLYAT